ncbi:helix-turn-helix domain-containing protein [Microvirga calopogonii]|uniref:helix-turn-helix domain-containing protein n=1 Tax=Microvirga calopogonii TaxID=2078013 RepID=UPI00197CB478|nr:hypothetical protein [Microvirga calopogonii]
MTPEQFRSWRKSHGLTQGEAANALGLGKRTVATYEGDGIIPKHVALACAALSHFKGSGTQAHTVDVEGLVKQQHPELGIGETAIILPIEIGRGRTYAELFSLPEDLLALCLSDEARHWMEDHAPSAKFSLVRIETSAGEREVAVVSFSNLAEAVHFKLRWQGSN